MGRRSATRGGTTDRAPHRLLLRQQEGHDVSIIALSSSKSPAVIESMRPSISIVPETAHTGDSPRS